MKTRPTHDHREEVEDAEKQQQQQQQNKKTRKRRRRKRTGKKEKCAVVSDAALGGGGQLLPHTATRVFIDSLSILIQIALMTCPMGMFAASFGPFSIRDFFVYASPFMNAPLHSSIFSPPRRSGKLLRIENKPKQRKWNLRSNLTPPL